jgi:hypothetical protein
MFARISKAFANARLQSLNWRGPSNLSRMKFSTNKDINRLMETAKIAQKVIRMIQKPFEASELEK